MSHHTDEYLLTSHRTTCPRGDLAGRPALIQEDVSLVRTDCDDNTMTTMKRYMMGFLLLAVVGVAAGGCCIGPVCF